MRIVLIAGLALGGVLGAAAAQTGDAIRTLAAIYGTPSQKRTCDATAAVARACDGKRTCDVLASNTLCGDPDYGTPKSLDVEYQCGPAVARSLTVFEQTDAHLSCE